MRKVFAASALSAVAIAAAIAATGAAAQGPLKVHGKVALFPTPTNTVDSKGKTHTTSLTITGKVKTQEACQGGRKIAFTFVTPSGSYTQSVTAKSTQKGAFTADLPFTPTGLTSKQNGTAITVSATATQVTRKDKETGEKVKCLEASGINDFTAYV
jgi:hypothetical protein